jgi:hypothetical protein
MSLTSPNNDNLFSNKNYNDLKSNEKKMFNYYKKESLYCFLIEKNNYLPDNDYENENENNYSNLKNNLYENYNGNCYFYILNTTHNFTYEGRGLLKDITLNKYVECQTEKIKPGYIMIKALESGVECAVSGLNGAKYWINDFQHVYFERPDGSYILEFRNSLNKILRFSVKSGRGYFIINSSRCIEMETNLDLPLYENKDNEKLIENEERFYNEFINNRSNFDFDNLRDVIV